MVTPFRLRDPSVLTDTDVQTEKQMSFNDSDYSILVPHNS